MIPIPIWDAWTRRRFSTALGRARTGMVCGSYWPKREYYAWFVGDYAMYRRLAVRAHGGGAWYAP